MTDTTFILLVAVLILFFIFDLVFFAVMVRRKKALQDLSYNASLLKLTNTYDECRSFITRLSAIMAESADFDARIKDLMLALADYYDSRTVDLTFIENNIASRVGGHRLRKVDGGYEFDSGFDYDKLQISRDFLKKNNMYSSENAEGELKDIFKNDPDYIHTAFKIPVAGKLCGVLSFDSPKTPDSSHKYSEDFVAVLQNIFTTAVEYYISNRDLMMTKLYMDTLFAANKDANYLIIITDENGVLQSTNASVLYSADDYGKSIFDIGANLPKVERGADDISLIKENFEKAKTTAKTAHFRNNTRKDLYLDTVIYPILDNNKKFSGVICLAQDVTEAVKIERQLALEQMNVKKASDRFEMAINTMNIGIMEYNLSTEKFSYDDNTKKLCDLQETQENRPGDLDKTVLTRLLGNKMISAVRNNCIVSDDKLYIVDNEITLQTGKHRSLRTYVHYVEEKNHKGADEAKLIGMTVDHTLEVEFNKKLLAGKEKAESELAVKSEFFSRIGYEIRTPMNAITGMVKISRRSKDIEKIHNCLDKIEISSKHLLTIIDDILDISKPDRENITIVNEYFYFEDFIKEIVDIASMQTENRRQNISVKIDPDIPQKLYGDKMRLNQVILNFFSNAVKSTPDNGKIGLSVDIEELLDDSVSLTFSVSDTGIGMEREKLSKLFMPALDNSFKNTGLGLMISKGIVDAMNGKIWAESKKGEGSKFSFTVSLKIDNKEKIRDIPEDLNNIRILTAGADEYANEEMQLFLNSLGFNHDFADNAAEAEELIKTAMEEAMPYDIIFIDWEIPDVDILDYTKRIIKISSENAVVLMTNMYDYEEAKKQAYRLGINKIVSKPLYPSVILDAILETGAADTVNSEIDYENEYDFKDATILFAEDMDINIEVAKELLSPTNINIDVVYDGLDAVEAFKSNPFKYNLILMDVQMFDMDGYAATKEIRNSGLPHAREIPIIALTANSMQEDLQKEKDAGMDGHLNKPIDEQEMLKILKKYIKGDQTPAPEAVNNFYTEKFSVKGIDIAAGLSHVDNKTKLYRRLLKNFKESNHIVDLKAYIACGNQKKAMSEAHTIKGITGNLGLYELTSATASIYDVIKSDVLNADGPEFIYYERVYNETLRNIDRILKHKGDV